MCKSLNKLYESKEKKLLIHALYPSRRKLWTMSIIRFYPLSCFFFVSELLASESNHDYLIDRKQHPLVED